jgi:hypothetical protein
MTRARPRQICCAARWPPCRHGHGPRGGWRCADAGYFAGQLARAAHDARIAFAIGARRIAPLWRLLAGLAEQDWHDAIEKWTTPRSRSRSTARTGGRRTPGC